MRPSRITAIRSATANASSWSWVTSIAVAPAARRMSCSSPASRSRSPRSRALSGSSSSSSRGLDGQRPGQGDPLALAPGEGGGQPVGVPLEADQRQQLGDPLALLVGAAAVAQPQRVGDVAGDVEVLEELAVLEHQREAALVGRDAGEVAVRRTRRCRRPGPRGRPPSRSSVDLPQPDGPSTATTDPAGTSRSTWSTATVAPKRTVRSRTSRPPVSHQNAPIEPTRSRCTANITTRGGRGQHHRRGHRHPEVLRARVADQPVDHHRQGRVVVAGQEAGRAELAERDREREPGRGEQRPPGHRQVDGQQHPQRPGAERGRRLALAVVDRAEHRRHGADDERQRDHRLRDRDQQRRAAQVQRRPVEGDQEAEADRDRRDPERQHEQPVEHAGRRARPSGRETRKATDDARASGRAALADEGDAQRVRRAPRWPARAARCASPVVPRAR